MEAFSAGILLVSELIIIGIQTWYILSLKIDGEIGNLRFFILLLVVLLSLLVVITPFVGVRVVPDFLIIVFLFLPVIFLKISQYWENKQGEKMEAEEIREKIGRWEHTVQKDPEFGGIYTCLGDLHLKLDEKDKALAYYKKALSLKPEDPKIIDQIRFIEKKMEMVPKLTKSDLGVVKAEFKKLLIVFGLILGVILGMVCIVYLLHVLPAPAVLIIIVIIPVVLLFRWIMKQ